MIDNNIKVGNIIEVVTHSNEHFTAYVTKANLNEENLGSSVLICRVLDGNVLADTFESYNIKSDSARAVILAGCKSVKILAEPEVSHPQFGIKIDESVSFDEDKCTCYQTKLPHLNKYITLCVRESHDTVNYGWSEGTDTSKGLQEAYTVSYTGQPREESIRVLKEDISSK